MTREDEFVSLLDSARVPLYLQLLALFKDKEELPNSLPENWPNPSDLDLALRPNRIVNIGDSQEYLFCSNFVKTSKYEVWNFLPKFLFEEFNPATKFANCYFLCIAMMQCVPVISNTNGVPTVLLPLTFVVCVDALFQILEDVNRHRSDQEANSSITRRFNPIINDFENVKWFELSVGDFVEIKSRETIPADVVIISCDEKTDIMQGQCYVETKSLDGETNLKLRGALPNTLSKIRTPADILLLKGKVEMEHPNKVIDSFSGTIALNSYGKEPIQPQNILLRGCVLRNTDWVIGLVVNTGPDTKIMMGNTHTKPKSSYLEFAASKQIQLIICLLLIVCFVGATGQSVWNNTVNVTRFPYLEWHPKIVSNWIVSFLYFILLHATFIPVSLYVTMAMTRFFQTWFMKWDLSMYYEPTDHPANVRTMTLNEELGQISHVFSDKTGTLTCNVMDFRKMTINAVSYGLGITQIGKASWKLQGKDIPAEILYGEHMAESNSVPHCSFYDPKFERNFRESHPQYNHIVRFLRILCLCHDVIPERVNGKIKLSASNPDDEALISGAKYFGYEFVDRKDRYAVLSIGEQKREELVEIVETIPFTSKRKRMSVVVRDSENKLWLYVKGADTMMWPRFANDQEQAIKRTEPLLEQYCVEGLRCLVLGFAELKEDVFKKWFDKYKHACADINQIEKRKKGDVNEIDTLEDSFERGLTLAGVTAIEDKLQDGVPETVSSLLAAGMRVWVLTGDKEETAINIGVACNLLQPAEYMIHVIVNPKIAHTKDGILRVFNDAIAAMIRDNSLPRALIIDGPSLITVLGDTDMRKTLLEFAIMCTSVVCCRVSPDQKREVVRLVRKNVRGVRTLAVGDGANDVAMIQAAHVGVGIRGEEGLQAVNSSDFSISQFRFLAPLLLKHGRRNYIGMSNLILYMFYKNVLMSMGQFWFNFYDGFSGQKYYTEYCIELFNLFFTAMPILFCAVYDQDVVTLLERYPELYRSGIRHKYFNAAIFWNWMWTAFYESVVLSLLSMVYMMNSDPVSKNLSTFWSAGALCFTCIVIIVNFKMFFLQYRWYPASIFAIFCSFMSYIVVCYIITSSYWIDWDFYYVWIVLLETKDFWLALILLCTAFLGKDTLICYYNCHMKASNRDLIFQMEAAENFTCENFTAALLGKGSGYDAIPDEFDANEDHVRGFAPPELVDDGPSAIMKMISSDSHGSTKTVKNNDGNHGSTKSAKNVEMKVRTNYGPSEVSELI